MQSKKAVLVGIYSLDHVGGAELYTCDLIRQFKQRDDVDVEFFAMVQGRLSDYVRNELGVRHLSKERYDLILTTHNVTVNELIGKGPIVQICHGAILDLELPALRADYHVGISKEICDSLTSKGFPNSLVLNGLDLEQKKPITQPNEQLTRVLSLCQSEEANAMLQNVCHKLGIEFVWHHKHINPNFAIEQEINKADLVVGIGRSIYDAMACGRPCIVFDSRAYNGNKGDGYLYPEMFEKFVQANCSGRYTNRSFTEEDMLAEFKKYNAADGERLREIAEEKLDVVASADKLLNIINRISPEVERKKRRRVFKAEFKRFRKSFKRSLKKLVGIRVSKGR